MNQIVKEPGRGDVAELADAVAEAFGFDLESPSLLKLGRAAVIRAQSEAGPVVVKRFRQNARDHYLRERTGLSLLSELGDSEPLVPRLLQSDDDSLLLVMSEVAGRVLAEVLDSKDPGTAAKALSDTAERLGTLHGAARSMTTRFAAIVPAWATPGSSLRVAIPAVLEFCRRALGAGFDRASVESELRELAEHVDRVGPLSTVTVGDMAPTNILLPTHGPMFVDLEYCSPRHAFYDAVFWHCICVFPHEVSDSMDASYRRGLEAGGLEVDADVFANELLLLASHRLFWTLSWNMIDLFANDRDFVPNVSTRAVLRSYLQNLVRLTEVHAGFGFGPTALNRLSLQLKGRLAALWEESSPISFPCFAGLPS